ncbi:MAG: hypothetical protein LBJ90_07685 [Treponema sp.]|jgi:diaminopimelate epimerase|nr:hypothetical protein [Treponema sp.]
MNLEIVAADPAGNITIFVLAAEGRGAAEFCSAKDEEPCPPARRAAIAKALLADLSLGAEQVGFVIPAKPHTLRWKQTKSGGGAAEGLWRLEMMGGEFCGNAARSFGLFVARETGLAGKGTVTIGISGAAEPLAVHVDTETGSAAAEMPLPLAEETLEYEGRPLPVYVFEGITHVIAEGFEADESLTRALLRLYRPAAGQPPPAAFGVMFYDAARRFMKPAVYVAATDSLVFESSCGSGSAALGVWLARAGEESFEISQPGGVIEVTTVKRGGEIRRVTIGGKVGLSGRLSFAARGTA